MMSTVTLLFFGTLAVVGVFGMVKIHCAEHVAAAKEKAKRKARLDEFRVKSFRPDGD